MVQFCPKCGTPARDDKSVFCNRCGSRIPPPVPEKTGKQCPACGTVNADPQAVFCNKCGTRIPPPVPEKTGNRCPSCGTINADPQAAFCNKCGSGLHTVPPVQVPPAVAQPAAAPPAKKQDRCPSCNAPRVDDKSDFCNVCGADFRLPARVREAPQSGPAKTEAVPVTTAREPPQPEPETTTPDTPVAALPDDGRNGTVQEKSRKPLLKWGLMAGAAVIVLIVIAAFFTGMLPGTDQSSDETPADTPNDQDAAPTTLTTIPTSTPAPTPSPTSATPVPTTVVPVKTTTAVTTKVSATPTSKVSAKTTTNTSAIVTTALTLSSASQPLSVGQSAWDGKGKLTVNGFSIRDKMSDPTPSYAVGKKYLILNITYENLDRNATVDADTSMMKVTDGGGYPAEPTSDAILETPWNGKAILPQEKRTGNLLFIVPPTATYLKLEYTSATKNSAVFQLT
jgi:hypothetical protein